MNDRRTGLEKAIYKHHGIVSKARQEEEMGVASEGGELQRRVERRRSYRVKVRVGWEMGDVRLVLVLQCSPRQLLLSSSAMDSLCLR